MMYSERDHILRLDYPVAYYMADIIKEVKTFFII